ncbi:MAG: hypothetical protein KKF78_01105 [Candidatus Omnitrophica bacterium]|nr:hypothetical protein [Candidatus Omnitrophota bacterium]MBU1995734.1 hypothetical protein [Candidatus Omnitrophota bacterium]
MPRKKRNRKIKTKIKKSFTFLNSVIFLFSVSIGFLIVYISGSFQESKFRSSKYGILEHSAVRLADAFEIYNQKRFSK